ncbi:MAG: nicotinate phosphoribosyltransferase [Candidatus Freyarchaeota archaeon]|nr:nicotinate phosphoribosyltransferase [Candidatus Jordarchaeia archaeon]
MRKFKIATEGEIKAGKTTDVYFLRTIEVLKKNGLDGVKVVAEVTTGSLPRAWPWAVLAGVSEVAHLLEGKKVDVYAMPEGTIFRASDHKGFREPVMFIEGAYGEFALLETPLLGLVCQASGIATSAARLRKLVPDKLILSFGIRRMHPAISPLIDYCCYIGGLDGVSGVLGAEQLGIQPSGTMPHALIIVFGDQVKAWKAFDEALPPEIPRIALCDTWFDEKAEVIMAAEALGEKLWGVRLDTPSSRRGDFAAIVREVRWELDARGYTNVKILVSGGIGEEEIKILGEAGADGFGVGTWCSNSPVIDFALDIVEISGKPVAKRGKLGGKKQVWRCKKCFIDAVKLAKDQTPPECPNCKTRMEAMLQPLVMDGEIVAELPSPQEIRRYVLDQLSKVST